MAREFCMASVQQMTRLPAPLLNAIIESDFELGDGTIEAAVKFMTNKCAPLKSGNDNQWTDDGCLLYHVHVGGIGSVLAWSKLGMIYVEY